MLLGVNVVANDIETNNSNVGIGYEGITSHTNGAYSTAIGSFSRPLLPGLSNTNGIGSNVVLLGSKTVRIENGAVAIIGGATTWNVFSDKRLKTNIKEAIAGFDFHGIVKPYDSNGTYALRFAEFVVHLLKGIQEQ